GPESRAVAGAKNEPVAGSGGQARGKKRRPAQESVADAAVAGAEAVLASQLAFRAEAGWLPRSGHRGKRRAEAVFAPRPRLLGRVPVAGAGTEESAVPQRHLRRRDRRSG